MSLIPERFIIFVSCCSSIKGVKVARTVYPWLSARHICEDLFLQSKAYCSTFVRSCPQSIRLSGMDAKYMDIWSIGLNSFHIHASSYLCLIPTGAFGQHSITTSYFPSPAVTWHIFIRRCTRPKPNRQPEANSLKLRGTDHHYLLAISTPSTRSLRGTLTHHR